MKKLILAAFLFVSTMSTNTLADIKMGIILGFSGPIFSDFMGCSKSFSM